MTFLEFVEIKRDTLDREWPNQFNDGKSDILFASFKHIHQELGRNVLLLVLSVSKTVPTVNFILKKLEEKDYKPRQELPPLPFCNTCNETGILFVKHKEEILATQCNICEQYNYYNLPKYKASFPIVQSPYGKSDEKGWKDLVKTYRAHMRYSSEFWKNEAQQDVQSPEVRSKESPIRK